VGLAQLDSKVGDFENNLLRVVDGVEEAAARGAQLVVTPGLAVTGRAPRDLLLDPGFVEAALETTRRIARELASAPPVLLGGVSRAAPPASGAPLHESAFLLQGGEVTAVRHRRLLANRGVHADARYFAAGQPADPLRLSGRRAGVILGEDLQPRVGGPDPGSELRAAGADLLVWLAADAFTPHARAVRLARARTPGLPLVGVNGVGADDELIFDGGSFVLGEGGRLLAELPRFEEAVTVVDVDRSEASVPTPAEDGEAELFAALVLGVRGFARKNGLARAFLGLSGGIDSSLVACIAGEALGPEAVTGIALPSRHTDPRSTGCARDLSRRLGIGFEEVELEPLHKAAERSLAGLLEPGHDGATAENVQARLRALVLMAWVNRHGGFLLNTSNKTELALGYGTLYGDLTGVLSVIGDLNKPQVYALARWYDRGRGIIPEFVLQRPPSAELRPDQVDPFDYPRVAPLVDALLAAGPLPDGARDGELADLRRRIRVSEHKRAQAGLVLRLSETAFGSGRLMPVTRAWPG
jgi:NAD+ synthase (glutamine-hydrolysing)